jgi:hypothetical protein
MNSGRRGISQQAITRTAERNWVQFRSIKGGETGEGGDDAEHQTKEIASNLGKIIPKQKV